MTHAAVLSRPHIKAREWLIEWRRPGEGVRSRRWCTSQARADAEVYRLAMRHPDARVWMDGLVMLAGALDEAVSL